MTIQARLDAARTKLADAGIPAEKMDEFLSTMKKDLEREERQGGSYLIKRGFQEGKQLTIAQKTSALFAEEPVVMGHVLRRGSPVRRITSTEYQANENHLLRLEAAGAIKIQRPTEDLVIGNLDGFKKMLEKNPDLLSGAGDTTPPPQEGAGAEASAAAGPPAEPPAVIVPPHPPSVDPFPPPPVEDPPAPDESPEKPEEPAVVASQPAEPLAEGSPVPVSLPQQVKPKQRRTRS